MRKIVIDTNFLMIPYKFRVDIFSEFHRLCNFGYKLCIFEQSIRELIGIINKTQSRKDKIAAQFALKLIKLKGIRIIKSEQKDVDSLILEKCDKSTVIATQDTQLKKELLKEGVSIIIMRQKKYLVLIEGTLSSLRGIISGDKLD